ncbi:NHLP leader peptide family RiPP precursor [Tistrella mobilis]|uniref:NHLP leader peptide family RiPP precursor n=1 Tax=Tistrella mobilis TaxID=171437 RepID=UPI0031F63252
MIDHDEALRRIIARAQEDAGFRDQLKAAPHAALTALFGMEIPAGLTISVLEDTPTHLHIVLPTDETLSDEALEQVAGGGGAWNGGADKTPGSGITSRTFGHGD